MLSAAAMLLVGSGECARGQWLPQAAGSTAELRGLSVVDRAVAWLSGARGTVVRTTDGGATWSAESLPGASALDLRAIHGESGLLAWAMSSGEADKGQARLYRTTDGGKHWALQYSTHRKGVFFDAIAFWDRRHGIALSDPVAGHFFLLTTSDGGAHWMRVPPSRLPATLPGEGAFAASGSCLTVLGAADVWIGTGGAAKARVFHSRDRGRHWAVAETPVHAGRASAGIFSLAFRDALHGVAVGGDYQKAREAIDNVALTDDGGRSWTRAVGTPPAGYMSAVSYVPGGGSATQTLVAVGLAGTAVSTDDGRSWAMTDSVAYNSVQFVAPSDGGVAAGPRGRVARWRGPVQIAKPN